MRRSKKVNISPRVVSPYQILRHVGKVAYELALTKELTSVHLVFHISVIEKVCWRSDIHNSLRSLVVDESSSYEEVLVEILD